MTLVPLAKDAFVGQPADDWWVLVVVAAVSLLVLLLWRRCFT